MKTEIITEMFSAYYNRAVLYVYSLSKDFDLSEDIVSNAFFKAVSTADDDIQNFKAWLFTICRNEYCSHFRKRKRISVSELDENIAPNSPDIIDSIIRNEQYRALYRAISLLSVEQREVITLFYFAELSVREISLTMGKSESNTKVLLHRARKSLKDILEV